MSQIIKSAIVRIKTADNIVVGAGFLVTERHLLTCAHVVCASLEQSVLKSPGEPVRFDFPFVAPKQTMTAQVVFWKPRQADGTVDIAGLELTTPIPDGAKPVSLFSVQETWGHPFRAFGFPLHHDDGVWASGVLRDKKTNGHIQIEDTKIPGYAVQPGFSGSPVWDERISGLVGMVVTAERNVTTKAAFVIPSEIIGRELADSPLAIEVKSFTGKIEGSVQLKQLGIELWPAWLTDLMAARRARRTISNLRKDNANDKLRLLYACASARYFNLHIVQLFTDRAVSNEQWNWLLSLPFVRPISLAGSWFYEISARARTYVRTIAEADGQAETLCRNPERFYDEGDSTKSLDLVHRINRLVCAFENTQYVHDSHHLLARYFTEAQQGYDVLSCEQMYYEVKRFLDPRLRDQYKGYLRFLRGEPVNPVKFGSAIADQGVPLIVPEYMSWPYYFAGQVLATYAQHSEAMRFYERALVRTTELQKKGMLLNRIGLSLTIMGELERGHAALIEAETLLQEQSVDWIDLMLNRQIWLTKRGDWQQCYEVSERLEALVADMPIYLQAKHLHLSGSTHLMLGNHIRAEICAEKSIHLSEKIGGVFDRVVGRAWRRMFAFTLRGNVALVQKEYDKAIRYLQEAISNAPLELSIFGRRATYVAAESQVLMGVAMRNQGRVLQSAEHLKQVVDHPKTELHWKVVALLELGMSLHSLGQENGEVTDLLLQALRLAQQQGYRQIEYRCLKQLLSITEASVWHQKIQEIPTRFQFD